MNNYIVRQMVKCLTIPFQVWWRIARKNAPFVTDTGAKNGTEKIYFWAVSIFLSYIAIFTLVYVVEIVRYILSFL